jgi:hypothetical protein
MEWLFTLLGQALDRLDTLVHGAGTRSALADWLGIVGVVFGVWAWRRAGQARKAAQEAAQNVKQALARSSTLTDFAAAVAIMEEIKRLHRTTVQPTSSEQRARAWGILPERYGALRQLLMRIRSMNPSLSDAYQTSIQNAVTQFRVMEEVVEESLMPEGEPANPVRLNKIITDQIDQLSEILEGLKQDVESPRYGRE